MEKLHAQTSWGDRRDRHKDLLSNNYVGHASLQCHRPSKWVRLRLEIKQNQWSILRGGSCISYQLADVQTYSHRPHTKLTTTHQRLTCALKYAWWGCCCLKDIGNKYPFRIDISLPYASLDWMGWACGLASQVKGPHTNGLLPMRLRENLDLQIDSQSWRGNYCLFIEAAATLHFWAHMSTSAVSVSFVLRLVAVGWSICSRLLRNTTSFQNTSLALLNFQPRSDPLGLFVELQGHMYDIELLDNKSLFQSFLSAHVVWAWSFSALCIRTKKEKIVQDCMVVCFRFVFKYCLD